MSFADQFSTLYPKYRANNYDKQMEKELLDLLHAEINQSKFDIVFKNVDKKSFELYLVSPTLRIPVTFLNYKELGLSDFPRKPGTKQAAARQQEILAKVTPESLLKMHEFEVSYPGFQIVRNHGWIRFCTAITILKSA